MASEHTPQRSSSRFQPPNADELRNKTTEELIEEGILDRKLEESYSPSETNQVEDDVCGEIADQQIIRTHLSSS
jgi:hypothetical protein